MYYIVQEKLFREENYKNLIYTLERLNLDYEIVSIDKFDENIKFKTNRTDIFPFGAVRMSKIAKKYDWNPGSFYNSNHDFEIYSKYYQKHLLNWDSIICKISEINKNWFPMFTRPTKDTKAFTGRVFNCYDEYIDFIESKINIPGSILTFDTLIQVASIKKLKKEIRFWVIDSEIITSSQYAMGNEYYLSDIVDNDAYNFVKEMITIYQPAKAFVIDIALTSHGYKIIEINCINSSGFYKADMNKLIMSLEYAFN